ncbi:MAG: NAD(P)H-dependent oxidoreductase [Oscillospiraceae bacterium]
MLPLVVLAPRVPGEPRSERLEQALSHALAGVDYELLESADLPPALHHRRILFAVALDASGINLEYCALLRKIRLDGALFEGCLGGLLVDGRQELYTKMVARELVFSANRSGCAFVGRPLVEATGSLANFSILAQTMDTDPLGAYFGCARDLVTRLLAAQPLHASNHKTSNTLTLWDLVKGNLPDCDITEIGLRNGAVHDCSGCPYTMCLHFGERGGCFYGGVIVDEVYPAILACNALLLLCPNYNDALSANLTAFVNRLTALFRQVRFYDKRLFGIVVSGYSGSDLVAEQLVAALNMNKSFFLPARFCMLETANDAGSILCADGIEQRAAQFSARLALLGGPESS